MKIQFCSAAAAALLLTLAGCAGDSDDDASAVSDGAGTGGATDGATSGGPGGDASDGATTTATTGATNGDSPTEPQPNGAECNTNEECESGMCFHVSILGGMCGECLTDEDCEDGGCSLPVPELFPEGPKGATCNDGELGGGCNTDEACQDDLTCSVIIDVTGILTAAGCSECDTDADCPGDQLCSPSYDIANISGAKVCVDGGTVPNGEGCDHLGSGDQACESGFCYEYDFMGFTTVGVCGECKVSADCDEGECQEPDIDTDTFEVQPPVCG